jgi:hypothetical protein
MKNRNEDLLVNRISKMTFSQLSEHLETSSGYGKMIVEHAISKRTARCQRINKESRSPEQHEQSAADDYLDYLASKW